MEIIRDITEVQLNNTVVALGKFDGFHKGHQLLLSYVKQEQAAGLSGVVFTFTKGDWKIGQGKYIDGRELKRHKAESAGVDYLVEQPFTKEFASRDPERFVKECLVDALGMKALTVGEDFRFGKDRTGDIHLLEALSGEYGYRLRVFEKMICHGAEVSSSRIRGEIEQGHMEEAAELLGCGYRFYGEVFHGAGIGGGIGYPTINQHPDSMQILPPLGVYKAMVHVDGQRYQGIANLGCKPTVQQSGEIGLETTIFDYQGDLYGKVADVELVRFLRPERKFASVEELKEQIGKDIAQAKSCDSI